MSINERIEKLIKHFGLSASAFADSIGIQRPSMSHILSGRNKASLDVVQKVLEAYPDVSSDWLISGSGSMIIQEKKENTASDTAKESNITNVNSDKVTAQAEIKPVEDRKIEENESAKISNSFKDENIEKIVIFYKNGTFKAYYNK